jgi:hypothetical protein
VEAIGNRHNRFQRVGKAERAHIVRRREYRETARLEPPEFVIVDEFVQLFQQRPRVALVALAQFKLACRLLRKILQLDAVFRRFLRDRRRAQIDRHAVPLPAAGQCRQISGGRYVNVQHGWMSPCRVC